MQTADDTTRPEEYRGNAIASVDADEPDEEEEEE
jgi:hypothetical protein